MKIFPKSAVDVIFSADEKKLFGVLHQLMFTMTNCMRQKMSSVWCVADRISPTN